ncbi:MAG: TetR/AcrR family transcriptional regulator [Chloroflexi bacterium]|nr:TetR/AcrR family transcriptional regulator [Chloroflexota bacterium]
MINQTAAPRRARSAEPEPEPAGRWREGLGVRPELILAAATELFRERGYHGVGVDDIGRAAGITGPAVYRHFPSKVAILTAVFDRITQRLLEGGEAQVARGRSPRGRLERLVAFHVDFVLTERALMAVYAREDDSLPGADRRRLRRRQRAYLEHWVETLVRLRPELNDEAARAAVRSVLGMLNSVAHYDTVLDREELGPLLERMAIASLLAAARGPRGQAPAR